MYEVGEVLPDDTEGGAGTADDFQMSSLIEAISNRINPSGTKEIVVRQYGKRQVEIIIPEVESIEVERVKRLISTAGSLEFRIVANTEDHEQVLTAARRMENERRRKTERRVFEEPGGQGAQIGFWARVDRDKDTGEFKVRVETDILRDARTGRIIHDGRDRLWHRDLPVKGNSLEETLTNNGIEEIDVLMATTDRSNVTGEDLGVVTKGVDETMRPCVNFSLKGTGADRFDLLTRQNLPDRDREFYRRLGIVLDETLKSAPQLQSRIRDRGRITGQFTNEEVEFLVGILRAGRLPATLKKEPINQEQIGSMLGDDTIQKGKIAIGASLMAVLIFVVIYYRFSGLVACFALLTNLLLILGLMILLKAPLTLPGMAGLVLTVGMSVDANVLIFERIREELNRGAALRMAIRNGFARATTTIVDANLTTLITAIVLYAIGTDQIRGFAVTLILGILMSMYTAIFCSRVTFDIAERSRWITRLNMMRILGATSIDFIGRRRIMGVVSAVLIVIGLVGVATRGKDMLDIDFLGGTSVTVMLRSEMNADDVRTAVGNALGEGTQFWVSTVSMENSAKNTVFKVDSAIPEVESLQDGLKQAFPGVLTTYEMSYATPVEKSITPEANDSRGDQEKGPGEPTEKKAPDADDQSSVLDGQPTYLTSVSGLLVAQDNEKDAEGDDPDQGEKQDTGKKSDGQEPGETTSSEKKTDAKKSPDASAGKKQADTGQQSPPEVGSAAQEPTVATTTVLKYTHPIDAPRLRELIAEASPVSLSDAEIELKPVDGSSDWNRDSSLSYPEWELILDIPQSQMVEMLENLKQTEIIYWPSYSEIGGKVAGDTRNKAIAALLTSLLGIVGYIWIRFQRVIFGLAAVVALIHDVLITLGAIAVSYWLAGVFGFLLIDEFKISLPVVAAFLTIIGYSLNDTIVVFDRIREVKGKSPDLTGDMINRSINQTLSRTVLTSLTTLIVVLILYTFGGQGIHGFAYALVVGVLVGTYSSIFIASPSLLWMSQRSRAAAAKRSGATAKSAAV